ncbi:MAG: type III polyketide synthase [Chitinivibrionales bacterium]
MQEFREGNARIAAVATANPPTRIDQQMAARLIEEHYGDVLKPRSLEIMQKVMSHPSIRTRYIAVDDVRDVVRLKDEDPDQRMERFTRWATDLSVAAAKRAMERAKVRAQDITGLVVNTCTGYICPGIATYLIEPLGLSPDVKLYDLVGAGCGGALPGLQIAQGLCERNGGIVLAVAVEICSATYQMGDDVSLIVSNALFGDGAAAAIVSDRHGGPGFIASASRFFPANRNDVRYIYKHGQLHNVLSPALPKIIGEMAPPFVASMLEARGLAVSDVSHWAIHAGGEKILAEVQKGLGLTDAHLAVSRRVLEQFGNMSSPTVLFELERILDKGIAPGQYCCVVGFGAGLSMYGLLLKG